MVELLEAVKKTAEDIGKEFIQKQNELKAKTEAEAKAKAEAESKAKGSIGEKKAEAQEAAPVTPAETKKAEGVQGQPKVEPKKEERTEDKSVQRRIDELVSEIKELKYDRTMDKTVISDLENELGNMRKQISMTPEEKIQDELVKLESERISKYESEDKNLSREKRREMTKEELEDWLIEDMTQAADWMTDRKLRRIDERKKDRSGFMQKSVEKEQGISEARMLRRHPELNTDKRVAELKSQGKNPEEISKIICDENPKMKAMVTVLRSNPSIIEKLKFAPDGPEILVRLMEEELAKGNGKKAGIGEEERARIAEEAKEAERRRLEEVESGQTSTTGKPKETDKGDQYNQQLKIFQRVGKTKADLDKVLARRRQLGLE